VNLPRLATNDLIVELSIATTIDYLLWGTVRYPIISMIQLDSN